MGEALGRELRNTCIENKGWSHCQWCLETRPHHVTGKPHCGFPHCMATQLPYMDFLLCALGDARRDCYRESDVTV